MLVWLLQRLPARFKYALERDIMNGWIAAVGGEDWYNARITHGSRTAQMHGKALEATLDAVLNGR